MRRDEKTPTTAQIVEAYEIELLKRKSEKFSAYSNKFEKFYWFMFGVWVTSAFALFTHGGCQ
jgi:hypothetical protein